MQGFHDPMKKENVVGNTVLLCVDLQNDYFEGGKFTLSETVAAANNAARLIKAFRDEKMPVVHVRHEFLTKPAPFFAPASEGADIHVSVEPVGDERVITKNNANSFRETDLLAQLKELEATKLVIVGAMSHFCVDATIRAAFDLGFDCTLAHDACATRDLEFNGVAVTAAQVQAAFMAALAMGYGEIISTDDVIAQLNG